MCWKAKQHNTIILNGRKGVCIKNNKNILFICDKILKM